MGIFDKKTIGLDISDNTIEVVMIEKEGRTFKVVSKNRISLENGVVEKGEIIDATVLEQKIRELFNSAKPEPISSKNIIFSIPEKHVFLHNFKTSNLGDGKKSKNELDKIIRKEAENTFPIESNKLIHSYKILSDTEDELEVLVSGVNKDYLSKWQIFFEKIGLSVLSFDPEPLATFRNLFSRSSSKPVCVIDFGSVATNISIFDLKGLRYSYSSKIAGDYIDKKIAQSLSISVSDSKIKKELSDLNNSDEVDEIIKQNINHFIEELKETFEYLKNSKDIIPDQIVLVGGMSQMNGLVEYIQKQFESDIKIKIGNSVILGEKIQLEFIGAVGLSLRKLQQKWNDKDPEFEPLDLSKINIDQYEFESPKKDSDSEEIFVSIDDTSNINKEELDEIVKNDEVIKDKEVVEKKVEEKEKQVDVEEQKPAKQKKQVYVDGIIPKTKKDKKIDPRIIKKLISIIGAIIILFLITFIYGKISNNNVKTYVNQVENDTTIDQIIEIGIFVALVPEAYSEERLKGRVVSDEALDVQDYLSAKLKSYDFVLSELDDGEKVWKIPLNEIGKNIDDIELENLVFEWLVYSDFKYNNLVKDKIESSNIDVIYNINSINVKEVEKIDSGIVNVISSVNISVDGNIELEVEMLSTSTPETLLNE
jgi:type IV pilus assembly protein PilM